MKSTPTTRFLRFFFYLLAAFTVLGNDAAAQTCCTLSGFQYSRTVTIDNTGGPAYTNVQVLFVFNTLTPVSQGKMNSNGSDIRFKDSNCGADLDYWIESGMNNTNTNIWILIPSIPANAVKTITMFYGNPSATPVSVFANVFSNVYTAAGTVTLTGIQNYDWFEIPAGATVNTQAGQILTINARRVIVSGTINGNNNGYGPQAGPGAGGSGNGSIGGGGGGYGGNGGKGGGSNNGGSAYGTASGTDIDMGSGGGGSDCGPTGPGGGAVKIQSEATDVNGTITMRGGAAANCCCGNSSEAAAGGAGGGVYIDGRYIAGNGTINANGGAGGNSSSKEGGGGGAGGRVKLFACEVNNFSGSVTVNGGANGSGGQGGMQPGQNGTSTTPACNRYSISVAPEVELPVADFATGNVCDGSVVNFTDASTIAQGNFTNWDWDFGDGNTSTQQNPTHTYASANTYNVTLEVTTNAGCTANITNPVTVSPVPTGDFSFADACASDVVNFVDNSSVSSGTIQTWQWNFGDGSPSDNQQNPTHTYAQSGAFDVTLDITSDAGCTATSTQSIIISPVPVADFSATEACLGYDTEFTDNSTITSGSIAQWSWDFDDGTTSTTQNPIHQYATDGTYNVTLDITSDNGCTNTATIAVTVHPEAIADFSASSECQGNPTMFTNLSSVASGQITTYGWNFDNNQATSAQQNPMYSYTASGTFNVTLTIETDFGCSASTTLPVEVWPNPVPDFSVVDVCLEGVSVFLDNSSIASGNIATYQWDFGDGSGTAAIANPTYTYLTAGQFDVELTTTSDNGCVATTMVSTVVNPNPVASFTFTDVCESQPNVFTDQSSVSSGTMAQWSWDFGDGSTPNPQQNPNHVYGTFGTFDVTLTASSSVGCSDDTTQTVEVYPGATAAFSATTECEGDETVFTDQSSASGGSSITTWTWDLGDGSGSSSAQNPTYTYAGFGTYNAVLSVETDNGCTSSITQVVTVNAVPVPDFTATSVCLEEPTVFTNQSTIASGSNSQWNWDFGDGNSASQPSPTNTYATDGSFDVTLEVISDQGCSKSVTQSVTVYPLPQVNFSSSVPDGCVELDVDFTDLTTINSGSVTMWGWTIESIGTSLDQNPSVTFLEPGTYDVSLQVGSDQGCVSELSVSDMIPVYPLPEAEFSWTPISPDILEPKITFGDQSTNAVAWNWDFAFGSLSEEQNPTVIFPDTGLFNVQLIVQNEFLCEDTMEHEVYIRPTFLIYIPSAFTPGQDRINDVFKVEGMGMRDFEMFIFDRWGKQLFYSNDPTIGWDGKRPNGEIMRAGLYVYHIYVKGPISEHIHTYTGRVSLVQ